MPGPQPDAISLSWSIRRGGFHPSRAPSRRRKRPRRPEGWPPYNLLKIRAQGKILPPLRGVGDAAPYNPCRKPAAVSHLAPPLFLHILYKLYRSHTKPGTSLQKLYRDCTAPWSIPARKCGTMALLPVKHCEMHKLYHINLVKRESTHI